MPASRMQLARFEIGSDFNRARPHVELGTATRNFFRMRAAGAAYQAPLTNIKVHKKLLKIHRTIFYAVP